MENRFTKDELASRANVDLELVERLLSLGIIVPSDGPAPFGPGDVYRIRLALACDRAGMHPESLAKAIDEGKLSLGFMDLPHYRWTLVGTKTYAELAAELDVDLEFVFDVVQAEGLPRPTPGDRIREDDQLVFQLLRLTRSIIDGETLVRTVRVYVESLRKIADAEATLFASRIVPAFEAQGISRVEAVNLANRFGAEATAMQEQAILSLYRRLQERRWNEVVIEGIEEVLEEMGLYERPLRPPAFSFVDLAGYTRLTEEHGDEAVARVAAGMSGVVDRVAARHGGQAVKWLGDGVMLYFRDPSRAVSATIEIVREAPRVGLPAHAGVAAGPVVVQDGDYFGRTVNMAARIGSFAKAGQTLVTGDAAGLSADAHVTFRSLGPVDLKGFARPVPVFEATVAS